MSELTEAEWLEGNDPMTERERMEGVAMTTDNRTNEPTPERWRKKPVEIEAMRYDGENWVEIAQWLRVHDVRTGQTGTRKASIPTLEGTMYASPGDWIIKGVQGEFYPCKPDIFEQTYERAALVAAQGAAPHAESSPTSSYISPSLPGMIRNLWKSDPSENSVRTALKLAGDLIQELIDLKASPVLPSSGVDEDALRPFLKNLIFQYNQERVTLKTATRYLAEWLKEQGGESSG